MLVKGATPEDIKKKLGLNVYAFNDVDPYDYAGKIWIRAYVGLIPRNVNARPGEETDEVAARWVAALSEVQRRIWGVGRY